MKRFGGVACVWLALASPLFAQQPKLLRTLVSDSGQVFCVAFTPDGKTLASGGGENVNLWDVRTGRKLSFIVADDLGLVRSVVISRDGKALAAVGYCPGMVTLWDLASRKKTATIEMAWPDASATFRQDGKVLVTNGDGALKYWDVATGKCTATLTGHAEGVLSVTFSPDGKTLASGSHDGAINLWDLMPRKKTEK